MASLQAASQSSPQALPSSTSATRDLALESEGKFTRSKEKQEKEPYRCPPLPPLRLSRRTRHIQASSSTLGMSAGCSSRWLRNVTIKALGEKFLMGRQRRRRLGKRFCQYGAGVAGMLGPGAVKSCSARFSATPTSEGWVTSIYKSQERCASDGDAVSRGRSDHPMSSSSSATEHAAPYG